MAGAVNMTRKNTLMILQNHWESLREGNLPPFRAQISPREMPDVLDTLFIFEHLAKGDTRVRIAGLKICEMMGMEVRGRAAESLFNESNTAEFTAILESVMQGPNIAHLELESVDKSGNSGLAEMILLPLRSDFGDVNRIIGCVTKPLKGFTAPIRFDILTVELSAGGRERRRLRDGAGAEKSLAPHLHSIKGMQTSKTAEPHKRAMLKVVS